MSLSPLRERHCSDPFVKWPLNLPVTLTHIDALGHPGESLPVLPARLDGDRGNVDFFCLVGSC